MNADTDTFQAHTDRADDAVDGTRSKATQVTDAVGDALDRMPDLVESARTSAERVAERLPEAAERARAGAEETTTRLQAYPDDTLRLLAVGSAGLAVGLYIAGAPRLFAIAAAVPAAFAGAAVATRRGSSHGAAGRARGRSTSA